MVVSRAIVEPERKPPVAVPSPASWAISAAVKSAGPPKLKMAVAPFWTVQFAAVTDALRAAVVEL